MSIVQSTIERMKSTRVLESRPSRPASRAPAEVPPQPSANGDLPAPVVWQDVAAAAVNINHDALRAQGLYPAPDFLRRQQEDYRRIRREIIAATRQRPSADAAMIGPIVVVTSALPGEGKSYTALNLALSVASEGIRDVLLIDADTVKRNITTAFGLGEASGLIDLLERSGRSFMEYVRPTSIGRLRFLPAGRRHEGASDLFSFGRVGPLFAAINAALDGHIVIVDTAPILLSSDTPVLTDSAGQVLLVVRAEQTLQDSLKDATSRVKDAVPVGLVLNDWSAVLPSDRKAYRSYYEAYENI
jgi:protein-tyrosine kinase